MQVTKLKVQAVDESGAPNVPALAEFQQLEDRIRSHAYDLFARRGFRSGGPMDDWLAARRKVCGAAELAEGKDKYVLKLALAGYEPDDIDVTATADRLFVKAGFETRKADTHEREGEVVHFSEFESGNVYRYIDLPRAIDTDRVVARLKGGILTVEAPWKKGKDAQAKQVKSHKSARKASSSTSSAKKSSKKKTSTRKTSTRTSSKKA